MVDMQEKAMIIFYSLVLEKKKNIKLNPVNKKNKVIVLAPLIKEHVQVFVNDYTARTIFTHTYKGAKLKFLQLFIFFISNDTILSF